MTEAELTRDFNKTGSTMSAEDFRTRLDEIREHEITDGRARATPVSPPAVAAPVDRARQGADEDLAVSYGFLRSILSAIAPATTKEINRRCDVKLGPMMARLATLETRCAANSMLLASVKTETTPAAGLDDVAIATIQSRLAKLEAQPTLRYSGVWRDGGEYRQNALCTHAGSLWISVEPTTSRPGTDNTWVLTAKRGAPGRDSPGRDAR